MNKTSAPLQIDTAITYQGKENFEFRRLRHTNGFIRLGLSTLQFNKYDASRNLVRTLANTMSPHKPTNDPLVEQFVTDRIFDLVKQTEGDVVIFIDAYVIRHGVQNEVVKLLKDTGFPVYATPMGKIAVDENWRRYGGVSSNFTSSNFRL